MAKVEILYNQVRTKTTESVFLFHLTIDLNFFWKLFINNEFVDAESGQTFSTYNPATEDEIAKLQEAQSVDIDKAVASARDAFKIGSEWRSMDASARGQLLIKFATLLKRDREYLSVNKFCGKKTQFQIFWT